MPSTLTIPLKPTEGLNGPPIIFSSSMFAERASGKPQIPLIVFYSGIACSFRLPWSSLSKTILIQFVTLTATLPRVWLSFVPDALAETVTVYEADPPPPPPPPAPPPLPLLEPPPEPHAVTVDSRHTQTSAPAKVFQEQRRKRRNSPTGKRVARVSRP